MTDKLWTEAETPGVPDASDGGAAGITTATTVQFQSAGSVSGVQYRAPNTISGTWTIGIWEVTSDDDPVNSGTGTLLDSKNVTLVAGVWQTLLFDALVPITPLTKVYRIGIWSSAGRYVATSGHFSATDVTSPGGFIKAWRDGNDTVGLGSIAQGTFRADAAFGYPISTSGSASYWVGAVFEPAGADLNLTDVPNGAGAGQSPTTLAVDLVLADVPNGAGTGTTAETLVLDRVLADVPNGAGAGQSPTTLEINAAVDVNLTDVPTGAAAGGSGTLVISSSIADTSVMPILLQMLACLQAELMKVDRPPANFHIRPGATFTPMPDSSRDECCEGIAWVRPGVEYESEDFPQQVTAPQKVPTFQRAIQVELGVERCIPIVSNVEGDDAIPTAAQWLTATQEAMDDRAALRRTVCCVRNLLGRNRVIAGQITPLENEGTCGGQVVVLTIGFQACDCI